MHERDAGKGMTLLFTPIGPISLRVRAIRLPRTFTESGQGAVEVSAKRVNNNGEGGLRHLQDVDGSAKHASGCRPRLCPNAT